jgi:hypothetical protein
MTFFYISLFAGAVGGFIGGIALSKYSMGTANNMLAGFVGGGVGSWLLGSSISAAPWGGIVAGAGAGVLLMVVAGILKTSVVK